MRTARFYVVKFNSDQSRAPLARQATWPPGQKSARRPTARARAGHLQLHGPATSPALMRPPSAGPAWLVRATGCTWRAELGAPSLVRVRRPAA